MAFSLYGFKFYLIGSNNFNDVSAQVACSSIYGPGSTVK